MPTPDHGTASCRNCPIWKKSLFSSLGEPDLDELAREKTPLRFGKGEQLFGQGEPATGIHCIQRGIAKVVQKNKQGRVVMVRIAPPGDTVGHRSIFTRATFRGSARATEPLLACRVPKETLLQLLGKNTGFAQQIILRMAHDIESHERDHRNRRDKNVRERLAELLLKLIDRCGEQQPDRSWKLAVQITKSDIAAMLGTAHETAIRFVSELKQEGVLRQEGRTLFIKDCGKLRTLVRD
jgi:CRP-like cAMP-binding protein